MLCGWLMRAWNFILGGGARMDKRCTMCGRLFDGDFDRHANYFHRDAA